MRIIEKMKAKIKNDERFIAKMILAGVLAVSIPAVVGGVCACSSAVNTNPDDYANDARYVGGVVSLVAGTVLGSAGVAGCIGNDDEQATDKKENNEQEKSL